MTLSWWSSCLYLLSEGFFHHIHFPPSLRRNQSFMYAKQVLYHLSPRPCPASTGSLKSHLWLSWFIECLARLKIAKSLCLGNSTVPFLFISHYYYNHGQDLVISKSWGWKPGPLPHGGGFASRELNPLLLTAGWHCQVNNVSVFQILTLGCHCLVNVSNPYCFFYSHPGSSPMFC
jgi:hypothetical protein